MLFCGIVFFFGVLIVHVIERSHAIIDIYLCRHKMDNKLDEEGYEEKINLLIYHIDFYVY